MRYYASHDEAFSYWYRFGPDALESSTPAPVDTLRDAVGRVEDLKGLGLESIGLAATTPDEPGSLHRRLYQKRRAHSMLVPASRGYHTDPRLHCHVWPGAIPQDAFRAIAPDVLVSSPEFTYLQLARTLDVVDCALVGMSLCSRYVLKSNGSVQRRRPLTTRARLARFLSGVRGIHGIGPARQALSLITDFSGSPTETELFAFAAWPDTLGGERIRGLTLNHRVQLTSLDRRIFDTPSQQYFEITLFHAKSGAGVDYESKPPSRASYDMDRSRRNTLTSMGLRVLRANAAIVNDPAELDLVMRQLAHLCGHDLPRRTPAHARAREELRLRLEGPDRLRL